MRSYIAILAMIAWSAAVAAVMYAIGFADHMHDLLWSLGAAVVLLIGLVGNVWIFLAIVKEQPWEWFKGGSEPPADDSAQQPDK